MTAWPHPALHQALLCPSLTHKGMGKGVGHMVRLTFVFQVLCQGDHLRLGICYT